MTLKNTKSIFINHSTFSGLANFDGGCLKIISNGGKINIHSTLFVNCLAYGYGGAIYMEGSV